MPFQTLKIIIFIKIFFQTLVIRKSVSVDKRNTSVDLQKVILRYSLKYSTTFGTRKANIKQFNK